MQIVFNPIFDDVRPVVSSQVEEYLRASMSSGEHTYDTSCTEIVVKKIEELFLKIIALAKITSDKPIIERKFSDTIMVALNCKNINMVSKMALLFGFTMSTTERGIQEETDALDEVFGTFTSFSTNRKMHFTVTWTPKNKYIYPSLTVSRPPYRPEDWARSELKLLNSGKFSDMTITVGEKTIPVHKFKLVAHSKVLETMFSASMTESQTNNWEPKNVSPYIVRLFLEFLYAGRIEFQSKHSIVASAASTEASDEVSFLRSFKDLVDLYTFAVPYEVENLDACIMYWTEKFAEHNSIQDKNFMDFFDAIFLRSEEMTVFLMQIVMLYQDRYLRTFFSCLTRENVDAVLEIATRHKLRKICTEISNHKKYHLDFSV